MAGDAFLVHIPKCSSIAILSASKSLAVCSQGNQQKLVIIDIHYPKSRVINKANKPTLRLSRCVYKESGETFGRIGNHMLPGTMWAPLPQTVNLKRYH